MAQMKPFDLDDLTKRMKGAVSTLKHEFAGLRTGRASVTLLEPVHEAGDGLQRGHGGDTEAHLPDILCLRIPPAATASDTPAARSRQACIGSTYRNSKCTMDWKASW